MSVFIIIFLLNFNFYHQIFIKDGVYNIIINNYYLYYFKRKIYVTDIFKHPNTFFRIKKVVENLNDDKFESFYHIEEIYTKYRLSYLENKDIIFNKKSNYSYLWNIIKINNESFVFKNENNCYIKVNNFKVICDIIPLNKASKFDLSRIYFELNDEKNNANKKLINREPIDILIKYIDLKDPNLKRDGIHQIEKDNDNEELRYSIRSILNNIPWVRKIFILMPNQKVRYFKNSKSMKEKITYVKDKDLLGYDSSNSLAFQFRYWKMKKFGISDNIIVMDDDCFIGKRLNKDDFFYVEDGKVVPLIITSNFLQINKKSVLQYQQLYKIKAEKSKEEQNDDIFNYSKYSTFLFVLNLFNFSLNENVFIPKYTHNAVPVNLNDIKEIYEFIYNSKYKSSTLDSLYRHIESLQFQMLILSYTFLKFDKKVKDIPYKFIKINNSITSDYKFSLFCINKGPGNYSYIDNYKAKIAMEYLFPNPSPYEIIDYSFLNISFNVVYFMDEKMKDYENQLTKKVEKKELFYFEIINFILVTLIFCKIICRYSYVDYY